MTDYRLSPDPAPKARVPGSGPVIERTKPASPIAALPAADQSLAAQLAEAREEIALLRSLLHGVGASLRKLADQIGHDVAKAEAKARTETDMRRRFS